MASSLPFVVCLRSRVSASLLCGTVRATTLPLGVLVVVGREGLCVSFLPGGISAVLAVCYAE